MSEGEKLRYLREKTETLYADKKLLFHGWHHIEFVTKKAVEIAEEIGADQFLVASASLLHDVNYLVAKNSDPEAGEQLRHNYLNECGYTDDEIRQIESIVIESHTAYRGAVISEEGKALSDADSLFKILPITPVIFSGKYIAENEADIYKLSKKIVEEQVPLMEAGIYFYTSSARNRYQEWAEINLALWKSIKDSLEDSEVQSLLELARKVGVI